MLKPFVVGLMRSEGSDELCFVHGVLCIACDQLSAIKSRWNESRGLSALSANICTLHVTSLSSLTPEGYSLTRTVGLSLIWKYLRPNPRFAYDSEAQINMPVGYLVCSEKAISLR